MSNNIRINISCGTGECIAKLSHTYKIWAGELFFLNKELIQHSLYLLLNIYYLIANGIFRLYLAE